MTVPLGIQEENVTLIYSGVTRKNKSTGLSGNNSVNTQFPVHDTETPGPYVSRVEN